MIHEAINFFNTKIENFLQIDRHERKKLIFLGLSFFFIIGSYSILRSLKTSIFLSFIGKEYQPYTRFIIIVLIIPCMFFYSKLVDRLKRWSVIYTIIAIYTLVGIVLAFFLAHPVYGVQNTQTNPYRLLGWAYEIYMDLYSALVVSTFWGFVNSVYTPNIARKNYGLIVAISRISGVATPLIGLSITNSFGPTSIPFLVFGASCFLGLTVLTIRHIVKTVPEEYLQGYHGTIKHNTKSENNDSQKLKIKRKKTNFLDGLKLMLTQPYVLGIFILTYSIEATAVIFDYQMQVLMSIETNNQIGAMSSFMFIYTASFQLIGFLFAIFGTSTLLKKLGTRTCLMLMPGIILALTITLLLYPKLATIFVIMIILRALNYGFNLPVRETLYIPTVKNIQLKSKVWVDSFGKTLSKSSGAGLIILSNTITQLSNVTINSVFAL